MTFGRWLLIHSFSIILVIILVLGYLYREELQLQQAYQQLLNLDQPTEGVIKSLALNNNSQQKSEPKTSDQVQQPVAKTNKVIASNDGNQSEPIQLTPTIKQAEFHKDNLLFDARQAFWEHDYKTAIAYYQKLIQRDPDNPDYSGELGNIYYAMNDYNNASELYFRTAQLLLQHGQRDAASQLLPPLNAMNRELGDKLKHSLMQR
jgi:tetratricopeptide (TPR) repeat protein